MCYRRFDIVCSLSRSRVCVINHKWLFGFQARRQQDLLAVSCSQHIQIEANVGAKKALLIEDRFSCRLNADKDNCFHIACECEIYIWREDYMGGDHPIEGGKMYQNKN